ncbi:hypothetical protein F2P81_007028 [Scophthalmus maximus]|uniref:Uncharacterized protein n=1 Tax=Scophthalmus maximus TaxID=52904 RepID=A0A6A4TBE5_SCOMX|nr:hypothetical protein F2P81_007028 [Scophthalmus maximus]
MSSNSGRADDKSVQSPSKLTENVLHPNISASLFESKNNFAKLKEEVLFRITTVTNGAGPVRPRNPSDSWSVCKALRSETSTPCPRLRVMSTDKLDEI